MYEPTTLLNVCRGAALELFQRELQRVLANIQDPNTDYDAKRTITLKIHFEPNSTREECTTTVEASSKIASSIPHSGTTFTGRRQRGGKVEFVAHESTPLQASIGEAVGDDRN